MENAREISVYEILLVLRKYALLVVSCLLVGVLSGYAVSRMLPVRYAVTGFMRAARYEERRPNNAFLSVPLISAAEAKSFLFYTSPERGSGSAFLQSLDMARDTETEPPRALILTVHGPSLRDAETELMRLQDELQKKYQPVLDQIVGDFKTQLAALVERENRLRESSAVVLQELNRSKGSGPSGLPYLLYRNQLLSELAELAMQRNLVTAAMAGNRNYNFQLVSSHPISETPVAPQVGKIIFLLGLLGLGVGGFLALFLEFGTPARVEKQSVQMSLKNG